MRRTTTSIRWTAAWTASVTGKSIRSPFAIPRAILEHGELREALLRCIDALPAKLRSVFVLKEFDGLDSGELVAVAGLSSHNHLWVTLSRAREHAYAPVSNASGQEGHESAELSRGRCPGARRGGPRAELARARGPRLPSPLCAPCRLYRRQLDLMREVIAQLRAAPPEAPAMPAALRARLRERLHQGPPADGG